MVYASTQGLATEAPSFTEHHTSYSWGGRGVLRTFALGVAALDHDGEVRGSFSLRSTRIRGSAPRAYMRPRRFRPSCTCAQMPSTRHAHEPHFGCLRFPFKRPALPHHAQTRIISGGTLEGLEAATEYHLWPAVFDGTSWRGWGASIVATTEGGGAARCESLLGLEATPPVEEEMEERPHAPHPSVDETEAEEETGLGAKPGGHPAAVESSGSPSSALRPQPSATSREETDERELPSTLDVARGGASVVSLPGLLSVGPPLVALFSCAITLLLLARAFGKPTDAADALGCLATLAAGFTSLRRPGRVGASRSVRYQKVAVASEAFADDEYAAGGGGSGGSLDVRPPQWDDDDDESELSGTTATHARGAHAISSAISSEGRRANATYDEAMQRAFHSSDEEPEAAAEEAAPAAGDSVGNGKGATAKGDAVGDGPTKSAAGQPTAAGARGEALIDIGEGDSATDVSGQEEEELRDSRNDAKPPAAAILTAAAIVTAASAPQLKPIAPPPPTVLPFEALEAAALQSVEALKAAADVTSNNLAALAATAMETDASGERPMTPLQELLQSSAALELMTNRAAEAVDLAAVERGGRFEDDDEEDEDEEDEDEDEDEEDESSDDDDELDRLQRGGGGGAAPRRAPRRPVAGVMIPLDAGGRAEVHRF